MAPFSSDICVCDNTHMSEERGAMWCKRGVFYSQVYCVESLLKISYELDRIKEGALPLLHDASSLESNKKLGFKKE